LRPQWEPTLVTKLSRTRKEGNHAGENHVVTVIGAGHAHSLAAFDAGRRVYTWGRGAHGRLGTRRHLNKSEPTEITHHFPPSFAQKEYVVTQAALGGAHTVVLCERIVVPHLTNPWGVETRLFAWGHGFNGQLGTDFIKHLSTPHKVKMPKWERVVNISAGKSHSTAVTIYGQLYTWGKGWFGALGHGDEEIRIAPTLVESTSNMFLKVSAGNMHTVALSLRRGAPSRRYIDKLDKETMDSMKGTPPVYLGLPRQTCKAIKVRRGRSGLLEEKMLRERRL